MAVRTDAMGTVWTVGHWTVPPDAMLDLLASAEIRLLADVRKLPGSRRSPQFDAATMTEWLRDAGIDYLHLTELGGRRPKQRDVDPAVNAGWHNTSFKNYADYALTPSFEAGLERLTDLASERQVAVMCGEPVPWRCHRLLIANALTARGWRVIHLMHGGPATAHTLAQWGATPVVQADGVVTYPEDEGATK